MRPFTAALLAGITALTTLTGCTAATTVAASTPAPASASAPTVKTKAVPTSKAPALTNTGTSWPKVVGSLITYGQWLIANPNPGLAGTITVAGCAAADSLTRQLQTYVDQNAYVQPAAPMLTSIVGPTTAGAQVTLDITAVRGSEPIHQRTTTRGTTHVTTERPALPPTTMNVTLIRGADARWRFCAVTQNDTDTLNRLL
ncbi:hypothetical protein [Actinoplanes sp. HUAS TT8]|uniref:hypothetical protein n=1 Tax=Actinoplanes sp. HUAS TT8 TaxID=3447453 RepID=UPI003F521DD3